MQGIVDRMQRAERTASILAEDGRRYPLTPGHLRDVDFDALILGTTVEFALGEGGKATDVHPAAEQITATAAEALDHDVEQDPEVAVQTPPADIEEDRVDEPSWESFPASDSPASRKFT